MTVFETLQQNLRNLRLRMGLTQEKAAEKIGVTYRHYQAIETEDRPGLQLATVDRIARALKVETWQLLQPDYFQSPPKNRGQAGRIDR